MCVHHGVACDWVAKRQHREGGNGEYICTLTLIWSWMATLFSLAGTSNSFLIHNWSVPCRHVP